jgi:sugar lactone lactonase YvrE
MWRTLFGMRTAATLRNTRAMPLLLAVPALLSWLACGGTVAAEADSRREMDAASDESGGEMDSGSAGFDSTIGVEASGSDSTVEFESGAETQPDSSGTTDSGVAVDSGLGSGGEAGVCTPSATRCAGNVDVETCDANGQWGAPFPCAQPTPDCSGGGCTCLETMCVTTCANEQTDNGNCGGCGVSCNGICSSGRCVVTIASGLHNPTAIAVDATSIYWTGGDGVVKAPLGGGTPITLATSSNSGGMVLDAATLYWATYTLGTVMAVSVNGGTPVTLAAGQSSPLGIAVDSTNVYWTNEVGNTGAIMSVPRSGGTASTLASGQNAPFGIAVDSTSVYWANSMDGTLLKIAVGGGNATTLSAGQSWPYWIATDATSVYWTAYAGGAVVKVPVDGGTATTLASLTQSNPYGIALDAQNVYWTNVSSGTVVKVPLAGGPPVTLAAQQLEPEGIAVDGTSVYWTDNAGGSVMKAPK